MRILVVNGSPRGKGNTYKVVRKLEEAMKKIDSQVIFEYLHLSQTNLKGCLGCYRCLEYGEENCPIKDEQLKIEEAMQHADAVIFASPVYVMNVSWTFKNFLDRFAYICHRPRFHGKKAWVVSSTGSMGTGVVNTICKYSVETWGFKVAGSLGAIISTDVPKEDTAKQWEKIEQDAKKAAKRFIKILNSNKEPKAGFIKLCTFRLQKASFGNGDKLKADYKYWKSMGWLEPECDYYIKVKVNPVIKMIANILADLKIRTYPKGVGGRSQ